MDEEVQPQVSLGVLIAILGCVAVVSFILGIIAFNVFYEERKVYHTDANKAKEKKEIWNTVAAK